MTVIIPQLGFRQSLLIWLFRCSIIVAVLGLVITVVHYTPVPNTSTFPECNRPCHELDWPMICRFKLHVEYYEDFRLCHNRTECPLGEFCNQYDTCQQLQDVYLINKNLLGPTIQVCKNDILVIDIINHIPGRSLSFHWHGQHVRETPSMDGVAMVTQCPVLSHTVYQYKLRAAQAGTHYYHALTGDKILDRSLQGGLIVHESEREEVHRHLYDEDVLNHTVHLTQRGEAVFVNGNQPQTEFTVSSNMRYRFRLIHGGVCPLVLSIVSHPVILIALDGHPTSPLLTDAVELAPGERLDFIITADKALSSYDFVIKPSSVAKDCRARLASSVQLLYKTTGSPLSKTKLETIEDEQISKSDKMSLISTLQSTSKVNVATLDQLRSAKATEDSDSNQKPDVVLILEYYNHDFNNISFKFPQSPLISQPDQTDPHSFCPNSDTEPSKCSQEKLCHCIHVIRIPHEAMVQITLLDKGNSRGHAFHLHGHRFQVRRMSHLHGKTDTTIENTQDSNRLDQDAKKASHGLLGVWKDTVFVDKGQTATIRFRASSPGVWSLHSQGNLQHQVLFQVGEVSEFPPTPQNFPTCGSYVGPDFFLI